MKRKLRTNKKFRKQNGKHGSKKVYKKRMTKKSRRGSRKMRGGVIPPFDANESAILEDEDGIANVSVSSSILGNTGDGETDSEAETTSSSNSFSGVVGLPGVPPVQESPNASSFISNGSLHLSDLAGPSINSFGVTDTSSPSFGGKRRKGKKNTKEKTREKGR